MPELPEVEIVRRGLKGHLQGRRILSVKVLNKKTVLGDPSLILGGKIKEIRRRGKGLIIDLDNGLSIAVHFKMTGQLLYRQAGNVFTKKEKSSKTELGELPDNYTRVIFFLDKDDFLFYRDVRKFGWISIARTGEILTLPFFRSLGNEPFDMSEEEFSAIMAVSRSSVKSVLLDQRKIAGVGNIYANEALFDAGIHPQRPSSDLSAAERKKLLGSLIRILDAAILAGGSSYSDYLNILGEKGAYQEQFLVYRQNICMRCSGKIQRSKLGGRGTFFCPRCQPL